MSTPHPQPPITVFWRPGCMFCSALLHRLEATDLIYRTVNIWEDDAARAFVRSVANGNETVPTVVVGDRALVNPSLRTIRSALSE
ncbi:MAG: glutaredoxin domain-containing protein [Acidimicrobiia bacterium]|nr:glutaredoxin domain-containing protein [Acidimicrobiia bacterium]